MDENFGLKDRNFFQGSRREYDKKVSKWLVGPQLHFLV